MLIALHRLHTMSFLLRNNGEQAAQCIMFAQLATVPCTPSGNTPAWSGQGPMHATRMHDDHLLQVATYREQKKLADKQRKLQEKAHRIKEESLRDDDNVFDVAFENQGGEAVEHTVSATDIKVHMHHSVLMMLCCRHITCSAYKVCFNHRCC